MINFRMMLLSTAAIGLTTAATMSSSYAADVEKKMAVSGQVNRAIITADDGESTNTIHQDGNSSGSRMRAVASAKSESMEIGTYIEFATQDSASNTQNTADGAAGFSIRHSALYLKNSMGKVTMGQTSHAADAFVAVDMSGTGNASGATANAMGALLFNDSDSVAGSNAAGTTVGTAHGAMYGAGRQEGISYDSPSFNGFNVKVSHQADSSGAAQATYGGDFNGVKVKAGYRFANANGGTFDEIHGGGLGITLANGLNFSANYATTQRESVANTTNIPDPEALYGKVGYTMSGISDLGKTAVAIEYRQTDDQAADGDDYESYALLVNQSISDYGTSVYGGYTNMSYDTTATNFDDIDAFWMGVRVTF
jgi:hypothetical protein